MKHIKNVGSYNNNSTNRFAKTSDNFLSSNILSQQIFGNYSFSHIQVNSENNPSHYKGKISRMEDTNKLIAEELALHEKERASLKLQKQQLETILVTKLQENSDGLTNDIDRLKNEIFRHIAQENAETSRLKNQEAMLRSENEILKQKISGLQSRISDLEKNIGNKDHNFGKTFV